MNVSLHTKRVLLLYKESTQFKSFIQILQKESYFVYSYSNALEAHAQIYNEPPDIILLSLELKDWEQFIKKIKNDAVYKHLPLILIIPKNFKKKLLSLSDLPFDDWVYINENPESLLLRIRLRENYTDRYLDANPLTRLPGNFSIIKEIQTLINNKKTFALGYIDIDNFKAFNDKYGFARGDDMIRMTARIITNVIRRISPTDGFVGHIGGDDFVFIIPSIGIEECCKSIIENFDLVSSTLSNDEDRLRGYIESEDRQGKFRKFPLPTLSIAVIDSSITQIKHPGEASSIAGEIKKEVKKKSGSNYFIDRRQL